MNGRMLCQIALALAATAASGAALAGRADLHDAALHDSDAHGGFIKTRTSVGVGLYFGPGVFYGGYPYGYPAPYYYPPAVVTAPAAPPQYIEQGPNGPVPVPGPDGVAPQQGWWYHCDQPEGYYPYVQSCPGGWQRIPAQPPANS
ncbi:Proline-rich region [Cupriavidus necator H850]|uniref:hypothetical protein n=1 Tax=Cupriavidus necator TaxID=106590 RepID=UPI00129D5A38|nr:hypothetical protein [Cupriavidus necator]KAI3599966.1 Proline-rich region [Cupriavidus necator H850]